MNNQFSQRVSDIITYSKEEANRLRNRYIGPEHLLLGMLRDGGGKAIEILMKLDIDLKQVKKRIESFLRDAEDDTLLPDADVPLSPMAAKILKMCILEARILKSATADAEHVLLAILKDGDNLAATVLEENRVNYQAVFEQLTMQSTNPNAGMGFPEEEEEDEPEQAEFPPPKRRREPKLGFWTLLGAALLGAPGDDGHGGRCTGDCAHCPPHFGYRYGRWYYGHGHVYGCEFGGNRGDGYD